MAGVVHDWCYDVGLSDPFGKPSRALSDAIWRDIAQRGESRANAFQAWVCWAGLPQASLTASAYQHRYFIFR